MIQFEGHCSANNGTDSLTFPGHCFCPPFKCTLPELSIVFRFAQVSFGAKGPGSCVLLSEGKRFTGAVDRDSVMSYIGKILPMVEVVDFGYANSREQITGIARCP